MNAKSLLVSLAAAALIAPATAPAHAAEPEKASAAPQAAAVAAAEMPSFAGEWRLDRSKSKLPQRPEGATRGERGMRAGGGMGPGGMGPGGGAGPGGMRPGREGRGEGGRGGPGGPMSAFIRIGQDGGLLTVSDSSGTVMKEIAYEDPAPPSTGIRRLGGEWNGERLVALGTTPAGDELTEQYTLVDGGKTLEVRTTLAGRDGRPGREFVLVYRRVEPK
jgi:hypothetical protein